MRFFSMEGPVFRFLTLVSELIVLNIVYLITCIPVVTIGAATGALCRTMLDRRYGRDAGVRAYFRFFKNSFRQATPRYLFSLLIGGVLAFDVWYTFAGELPMRRFLIPFFLLLLTVFLVVSSWVLALTGQFDNTAKGTFKNAAVLSLRHPLVSFLLLLRFLPALLSLISPALFLAASFLFFFLYYALCAYLAAIPMSRVFLELMTPEEAAARTCKEDPDD